MCIVQLKYGTALHYLVERSTSIAGPLRKARSVGLNFENDWLLQFMSVMGYYFWQIFRSFRMGWLA